MMEIWQPGALLEIMQKHEDGAECVFTRPIGCMIIDHILNPRINTNEWLTHFREIAATHVAGDEILVISPHFGDGDCEAALRNAIPHINWNCLVFPTFFKNRRDIGKKGYEPQLDFDALSQRLLILRIAKAITYV